ncbi:MAG TPA: sulfatase-like hydrolase/transferase [Bryobacteraceae bacterium]|nr:sulfatase-like hydrolase/transferase [Bryobacteraceae bacterium]
MVTRRTFLSAAPAVAAAQSQNQAQRDSRPNLILYMADELRAESIACYGHPLVRTPNIDRLASQGTRFEQCHVQNPVCAPSRCSLATGWPVHVRGHRSLYYALHPDEPNLFRYLKEAGYDVYWFGKNDLLAAETFASSVTRAVSLPGSPNGAFGPNPYRESDPLFYSFLREKVADRRATADYANLQAAIEIMERPPGKPFCIFLPLLYPHPPYAAPEEFHEMYRPGDLPPLRPPGLPNQPRFHEALRRKMRLDQLQDADFRKVQATYLGMVSYTDWLLGQLMQALERTRHEQDTALFFFADHGDYAGDYGLVEKWPNAMNDPLTRIPLIARVPGGKPGHVSREIVEQFDVMATCLELAKIPASHTHFARSLTPQLAGQAGDPRRAAFCEGGYNTDEPQCFEPLDQFNSPANMYYPKVALQNEQPDTITRSTMVRTADHKLIYRPDDRSELYDLRADPRELRNVYGDAGYAAVQADLSQRLLTW